MRLFAWLAVAGLVIGSISVSYAIHETTMHEDVWIQRELRSQNAARFRRLIRDIDEEVRPAGVIVSPWPVSSPAAASRPWGSSSLRSGGRSVNQRRHCDLADAIQRAGRLSHWTADHRSVVARA